MTYVPREDSDRLAYPRSTIKVIVRPFLGRQGTKALFMWTADCTDAQADPSLHCLHMIFVRFAVSRPIYDKDIP